jgi:hypothetical protein
MIQTGFINNLTYMTTVGISTAQTNDTDWVYLQPDIHDYGRYIYSTLSVSLVCAVDIATVVMYVRLLINPVCIISLCCRYTYRSHVCQVVNTPSLYH